jgi:Holliday junction DNA helicase RuvB
MITRGNSSQKTSVDEDQASPISEAQKVLDARVEDSNDTENGNILRPTKMSDYIGQQNLIRQLSIILESAKIREKLPEHMLFYGQPGLGKTTMAHLIAYELQANLKVIAAPALQKTGDIISLLVNCEPNTVLFIDEIHRLRAPLEEILYSAMEDYTVDILVGKGQGTNTVRMDLSPFVLIGATTQPGKLSKPLKDRFTNTFHLQPYADGEMIDLIDRSCGILKIQMDDQAKFVVCKRSRGVPRIANKLLKRLVDLKTVHKLSIIDKEVTVTFFDELGIFEQGLTMNDIRYLEILKDGHMGIKTIADVLQEEPDTIEVVTEPYLTHLGFMTKSSEGRKITPKGLSYIKSRS